jgi:Zn-dependent protease
MRTHIRLGRVFGIEIGLHYSWFLIALLIVFSLGGYFRVANPGWSTAAVWALAGLTGVLFFVSLLLHELAHCLVAKACRTLELQVLSGSLHLLLHTDGERLLTTLEKDHGILHQPDVLIRSDPAGAWSIALPDVMVEAWTIMLIPGKLLVAATYPEELADEAHVLPQCR